MRKRSELLVEGKRLEVSNLEKVLYPATGFTKGQVIDYYIRIAPVLLPHLRQRPLTLKRYPEGVDGFFFYEKQCPAHRPGWIKTTRAPRREKPTPIDYCVVDALPALVWVANLADLELHTFLHQGPRLDRPTEVAFDLDPGPPAAIAECCRVALRLKEVLDAAGLEAFPKTSGSKGLQVYVPLHTAATYDATKAFARGIAERLAREQPDRVVSVMRKSLRAGKVFVDWSQNDDHKTTICVYSLRAMERPTISTPVTWEEVAAAAAGRARLVFEAAEVLERVREHGDLFEPVTRLKQKLPREVRETR